MHEGETLSKQSQRERADHELVAQVVAGQSTAAYGELVRRHQSQVRGFLRRLARDPALADDLSQDCFVRAWQKIHTYSGRGSFIGWLLKIAYTTFLQSRRKAQRYGEILDEVGHREQVGERGAGAGAAGETGDLDRFLAVLTQEEQAVLLLSYAYGLSHREIGETTGLPIGTVKSIIHRSKEKIRERFDIENHRYG